ncbi:MAG: V-type ATP synthase subunit F [Candidatus Methanolliviera hydrocarbonicum]|jgi:Archaeal/vacuolar-type H+-ATPase subunit F|uniref:V-type ATP synthase subunit F n=1 Tax=Candidatus Methanolliviera hydrocarbonicum TaxID=2491085 RepID=A0A520KWM2_9EURY|nr:MAG: V-type ATP synthase subunit F [Candidatus Methanolliviera hydrocarbonicum]
MGKKIAIIGDDVTRTGFKLGGMSETFGDKDLEGILSKLAEEDFGIAFITEKIAEKNRETIDEFEKTKRSITPILIEIPDYLGPMEQREDSISKLIKRAIGVEIIQKEE